jgi:hypothetical protein
MGKPIWRWTQHKKQQRMEKKINLGDKYFTLFLTYIESHSMLGFFSY